MNFVELVLPKQPLIEGFQRPQIAAIRGAPTYVSISLDFVKKEIIEIFSNIGLESLGAVLFRKRPGASSPIHRDLILEKDQWKFCNYGVNWNLDETNSIMEWFQTNEKEKWPIIPMNKQDFILSGINYGYMGNTDIDATKFIQIESLILKNPTLVRTDIPHRVKNLDTVDRWCLSLRFKQYLSWEEAKKTFHNIAV